MADLQTLVHSEMDRAGSPSYSFEDLSRRRARRQRNRRIGAAVLAIIVAVVSFAALISTFRTVERPANEPMPAPTPSGIFADVGGWIAFSTRNGIWAVDPTRPNGPKARSQLSDRPGAPLAWSSDGSKLLISRAGPPKEHYPSWTGLFVLNADGTETRLVVNRSLNASICNVIGSAGSFSPDGSQVVFATFCGGIYRVDAHGDTPRLVLVPRREPRRDPLTGRERTSRTDLFAPAFSPDGTQIAYVDGHGDWGNTLRVMNADGTGVRVLVDEHAVDSYGCPWMGGPAWSPDGTRIAFTCGHEDSKGVWVIGADGSGLTLVIPDGLNPHWSLDGSRIAFELLWRRDIPLTQRGPLEVPWLAIANADGTHVQQFGYPALAGPWNPVPLSKSGDRERTAAAGGAVPFVYAIVALGVVAVLVLAWRVRRRTAAR